MSTPWPERLGLHLLTRALRPLELHMADISGSIYQLRAAIEALPERIAGRTDALRATIEELRTALANERAAADTLVATEAAEDVDQDAALADARAATDALSGQLDAAAGEIDAAAAEIGGIATDEPEDGTEAATEQVPDPAPAGEPDVDSEPGTDPAPEVPADPEAEANQASPTAS